MEKRPDEPRPIRTLPQHFWGGLKDAQRRRPMSFYLLLSIPVVLLLAAHLFRSADEPKHFIFGASILFVFLGAVLIGAFLDMFSIVRETVATTHRSYQETLGDEAFLAELRKKRAAGEK